MIKKQSVVLATTLALAFGGTVLPALKASAQPAAADLKSCLAKPSAAWDDALHTHRVKAGVTVLSADAGGKLVVSESKVDSMGQPTSTTLINLYANSSFTGAVRLATAPGSVVTAKKSGSWLAYTSFTASERTLFVKNLGSGATRSVAVGDGSTLNSEEFHFAGGKLLWLETVSGIWSLKAMDLASGRTAVVTSLRLTEAPALAKFIGDHLVIGAHTAGENGETVRIIRLDGTEVPARDGMTANRSYVAVGRSVAYTEQNSLLLWDFAQGVKRIALPSGVVDANGASGDYVGLTFEDRLALLHLKTGALVSTQQTQWLQIKDGYLIPSVTKLSTLPTLSCK